LAKAAAVVGGLVALLASAGEPETEVEKMHVQVDPLTRYLHLTYQVPAEAPEEVTVLASWSPLGKEAWRPAKVTPLLSETALRLAREEEWQEWIFQGRLRERRARGLPRTVVFNPYPEAQEQGKVAIDFRIQIQSPDGRVWSVQQCQVQADNSDVLYLEDWSQVMQKEAIVSGEARPGERKWSWRTDLDPSTVTFGHALWGRYTEDLPLPQLSYPLDLKGEYAIFVCTDPRYGIRLRLTGDERTDLLSSPRPFQEVLWRWSRLDRQHLVLKQPHSYQGYTTGHVDYIKLVPLAAEQVQALESQYGEPDWTVVGYFEPYSWAFFEEVQESLQHREPLVAFAEARVGLVDIQIGRFGAKVVYESRLTDPLLYETIGDPIGGVIPRTGNVGRMQQLTNTLQTELRYARELGLKAHANFGATNCYPETPLQGEFPKQHPEWVRGHALRYEVPEVRHYLLALLREALEIGAEGLSLDFCRYPEGIDGPETANQFLRELKALREEFAALRGQPVPLLVRFPAQGVRGWPNFDYATWVREGLVEYLCPSNIQGRHLHFDVTPYVQAVRGTSVKLLPVVDGLSWGLEMPGLFLWRVRQLDEAGVDGIYLYQADARVCTHNRPEDRRWVRLAASRRAVRAWWERYERSLPHLSKGIYLQPSEDGDWEYHPWERCRLWLEGIAPGEVEIDLDGKQVNAYTQPPYLVGNEEYESDGLLSPGEHILEVRARDGDGWLEQKFTVYGAR